MKRSQINQAVRQASNCFEAHHWALPPNPRWDVTDFGLGNFEASGLVLINLAEEAEYCEKLMYARKGQTTPAHAHKQKKEDIIVRQGVMCIQVWKGKPGEEKGTFCVQINGVMEKVVSGALIKLQSGERITLEPGIYHEFYPESDECILGEVSTANDDLHDNFFINPDIGRFSSIDEDEPPLVQLVSDK